MSRRNESLRGQECEHSKRCLIVAFKKVYREGSSNRRPKVPNGNNKNAKKTQKYQTNIRVCTRAALYDSVNAICEHSQNVDEMNEVQIVGLKLLTPQKHKDHSEIQKEHLSVNTSRVLG